LSDENEALRLRRKVDDMEEKLRPDTFELYQTLRKKADAKSTRNCFPVSPMASSKRLTGDSTMWCD